MPVGETTAADGGKRGDCSDRASLAQCWESRIGERSLRGGDLRRRS